MPTLNLNSNLNEQQRTSITNLLGSGRTLNETDARNLAYATGQSNNWQQFLNQSASNYSIGNLAQFATPSTGNINPTTGSQSTIPNLGQSTMNSFFQNTVNSGLTQLEQSILNYTNQQQQLNESARTQAQSQYDQAFAGLEGAYNQQSGLELMRGLMAEQGIQDKQNQLVEFQKQLANLQNQFTVANNAIGNQPINTAIIRGQQYLKQQEFAAKATLVQSQAAIVEGQLNMAKDLVTSYYDAATQDRQNQIARYQTLLGLADQKLVKLDAADKESLNMIISTLQSAETRQQENKDKISALLLDPIASIAISKTPGISLDMNYNELVKKLMPAYAAEQLRQFGIMHPGSSGSSSNGYGLGITGNNFTSDLNAIAKNFANMGTNLTSSQYTQALIALGSKYDFDVSSSSTADWSSLSSDLNNAIARYRIPGSVAPVATDTGNIYGPNVTKKTSPKQKAGNVTNFQPANRFGNLLKLGNDLTNWWNTPR